MSTFLECFKFRPEYTLWCGIERERFITNGNGTFLPWAQQVLTWMGNQNGRFGYELSACQIEDRIGPCQLEQVISELESNEARIKLAERALGFKAQHIEVAPNNMPLDIYPDDRYQRIAREKTREEMLAACQVTGTHIHIGMPNPEVALSVYNQVIKHLPALCREGDSSQGRRLATYKKTASNWQPVPYESWQEFSQYAEQHGFTENPRDCWHLIRISKNGTIEFRPFGVTNDLQLVYRWAVRCHQLCQQYFPK